MGNKNIDFGKTYCIEKTTRCINVVFDEKVTAKDFFYDAYILQKLLEVESKRKIIIDISATIWFDTLAISYLLMFCKKNFDLYDSEITFKLSKTISKQVVRTINLKKQFTSYLFHMGFYKIMKHIGNVNFSNIGECSISSPETLPPYSKIHNCIFPCEILTSEENKNEVIDLFEIRLRNFLKDKLKTTDEIEYLIHKSTHFLHETIQNVFEHAYNKEIPYCCLVINSVTIDHNFDTLQYEKIYTSKTPYIDISLYQEKTGYLEIFVSDIGCGLRKSFLSDSEIQKNEYTDRNLLEFILTDGERSQKKSNKINSKHISSIDTKHSLFGGLSNLRKTFYDDGDRLGIKSDSGWMFGLNPYQKINNEIHQHDYSGLIHGFAIIGFISLKNNNDVIQGIYKSLDINMLKNSLYCKKNPWMKNTYKEFILVIDERISLNDVKKQNEDFPFNETLVYFPNNNIKKDMILRAIYNSKCDYIIIADIPEIELKHFYSVFNNLKATLQNKKKIILISKENSVLVFTQQEIIEDGKTVSKIKSNLDATEKYLNNFAVNAKKPIYESYISFRQWQKTYDSETLWETISNYNKLAYINATVSWNNKQLRGYLDFSQVCLIPECRKICLEQLHHLKPSNKSIYFRPIDKFTNLICDIANSTMSNDPNSETLWIGSIYVSGFSEQRDKEVLPDESKFYFFKHYSSDEKSVLNLLEWSTLEERLDAWFPHKDYSDKNYSRLGSTSFLADGGSEYFLSSHYNNELDVFKITHNETFKIIQNHYKFSTPMIEFKHLASNLNHELIAINPVNLFENDKNISLSYSKLLENNSFDFLLTHIFRALIYRPNLNEIKNKLNNKLPLHVQNALIAKLKLFYKNNKKLDNTRGIFIYVADTETSHICEYFRELFSLELSENFIPIIPISESFNNSFNISPLILENLKKKISNIKKINLEGEVPITIFSSSLHSSVFRKHIKHLMYILGATKTYSLTLIDKQNFTMGTYGKTNSHSAFIRIDLPTLSDQNGCKLCNAIQRLDAFKDELRNISLNDRIDEIMKIWKTTKLTRNNNLGIRLQPLELPKNGQILKEIKSHSCISTATADGAVNLHTNLALIIYCLEYTNVTLSTDFLEICLTSKLSVNNKIEYELDLENRLLLYSTFLLTGIQNTQISKMSFHKITKEIMKEFQKDCNRTNTSSLLLISIVAQTSKISKEILDIIDSEKLFDYNNDDYLILLLWLKSYLNDTIINYGSDIMQNYSDKNKTLKTIYNLMLYTDPQYGQSHTLEIAKILYSEPRLTVSNNKLLYGNLIKHLNILESIYKDPLILCLFYNTTFNRDTINLFLDKFRLIEKYVTQELYAKAKNELQEYIDICKKLNKGLFLSTKNKSNIIEWLESCESDAFKKWKLDNHDEVARIKILYNRNNDNDYRFYTYKDISDEVINLIYDIYSYAKSNIHNIFNNNDHGEYRGFIMVETSEKWISLYFYNTCCSKTDLKELNEKKISKEYRFSMLIFEEFKDMFLRLGIENTEFFSWEFVDEKFDFKRNNEKLIRAHMKIPFLDMGSSYRTKENNDE